MIGTLRTSTFSGASYLNNFYFDSGNRIYLQLVIIIEISLRGDDMAGEGKGDVLRGFIWMFFLSILLFWLPLFGGLIAGFVGGRKAGELSAAVLAALLPAIIIGSIFLILGGGFTGFPLSGMILGAGSFMVVMAVSVPLLIGAIIGGATAS
jgi:hypothetical protein